MTFNSGCPFCEIYRGRKWEDFDFDSGIMRFTPLNPVTKGHKLFVPAQHYEHDDVGASEVVAQAFGAAHLYAGKYLWDAPAFNLITSFGAEATQTVPHLHIHLIPRREGDGLELPWGLPHEHG